MLARLGVAALAGLFAAQPLSAEVIATSENGFITRDEAVIDATTKEVWLTLITPGGWWNSAHTWSGDAANMTIRPQAGGCFCERIPEDPNSESIMLEGSVEHMRVIQAYPERALRMQGSLGPLQSEPVVGILTVAISEVEEGTRVVWEYAVGGAMRYEVPVISKAVDGVMTQQLTGLAEKLGVVRIGRVPVAEPETEVVEAEEVPTEGDASTEEAPPIIEVDSDALDAALGVAADEEVEVAEEPERDGPSVDEAFGDFLEEDG